MKPLIRPNLLISKWRATSRRLKPNRDRSGLRGAGERGSVTLEAALAMPAMLLVIFFLLHVVHTAIIAMALQNTLSQTVQLTATAWHAVAMVQSGERSADDKASREGSQLNNARHTIGELGPWLPTPLNDWAQQISGGIASLEAEAARLVLGELALRLADSRVLDASRMQVTSVTLPEIDDGGQPFVAAEATYRLPFRLPWNDQPLQLRVAARERAWVGGVPSRARAADPQAAPLAVSFVSLEPNPVRPGRKATLVLATEPGAVLDLSILYKSGRSQAKHLGTAVADGNGRISWTWHVSGNTTSGDWHWEVTGAGGATYKQSFRVDRVPTS